jgi:hypothetical protein
MLTWIVTDNGQNSKGQDQLFGLSEDGEFVLINKLAKVRQINPNLRRVLFGVVSVQSSRQTPPDHFSMQIATAKITLFCTLTD